MNIFVGQTLYIKKDKVARDSIRSLRIPTSSCGRFARVTSFGMIGVGFVVNKEKNTELEVSIYKKEYHVPCDKILNIFNPVK